MSVESSIPRPRDSAPRGAVFLSYASQDAEAAKKICDALRAAGVEVWFDQSELVGGDAWDQKIRKQIKECALLIPLISANTQARAEGYFRLEWRLADQRTHLMGRNKAFLLPVAIDGTTDADADVPDSFTAVQWTKAPGGAVPPAFVARVGKLLSGELRAESREPVGAALRRDGSEESGHKAPPAKKRRLWLVPVILAAVFAGLWQQRRNQEKPPVASPPATASAQPASPARQMAEKAWMLALASGREAQGMRSAIEMGDRAIELDKLDGEVWARAARVDIQAVVMGFDQTEARKAQIRTKVAWAKSLAPRSVQTRLAEVGSMRDSLETIREQERILRELEDENHTGRDAADIRGNLAGVLVVQGRHREGGEAYERAGEHSPGWMNAASWAYLSGGLLPEALRAAEKQMVLDRDGGLLQVANVQYARGDLGQALAALAQMSPAARREEVPATGQVILRELSGDPDGALADLGSLPIDYLQSNVFTGPKRLLAGWLQRAAGRPDAARLEWQAALRLVEQRLAEDNTSPALLWAQFQLLACLGRTEEAEQVGRLMGQLAVVTPGAEGSWFHAILGHREETIREASREMHDPKRSWLHHSALRYYPQYEFVRHDPRFAKLLRDTLPPGAKPFDDAQGRPFDDQAPLSASGAAVMDGKSIAVLPFASLSTDKENEFFADGVHDDVITNLAKIRDLKVISRTSTLAYRKTEDRNLRKIAAELGVATVLEGSVRRVGNKVRMNAQLIDARTDAHLWADVFEGDTSDIFALQAELAQKIAAQLKATLTSDEKTLIERRPTNNPEAYEAYVRGRVLEERLTQNSRIESYEESIRAYQQAVTLDPTFALAYARLTRLHGTVYWFGYLDPTPARKALVEGAVEAAQRNAPNSPETHFARGVLEYFVHTDWERALAEYRLAEAGLPNDIQLQYLIAFTLRRLGRWSEALDYMQRSLARGPRDLYVTSQIGAYYRALRRYDDAINAGQRCIALFPQDTVARSILAVGHFEKDNDLPAYLQALAKVPPAENDPHGLQAAYLQALLTGDLAAADRALADPRLTGVTDPWVAVLNEPVAFHRARVAWLRGDIAAAKKFAEDAIAEFNRRAWNPRQRFYVAVAVCEAQAYAGRGDVVLREMPAALAAAFKHDAYGSRVCNEYAGQAYLVLGRREDAIAMLRALMTGPSFKSPNSLRIDPFWSRLKDDPRFEEILKSAKPL